MNNEQIWLLKLLTLSQEEIFLTINSFEERKRFFLMDDSEDEGTFYSEAGLACLFSKVFGNTKDKSILELLWLFQQARISTSFEGFKYLLVINKLDNLFWDVLSTYAKIILNDVSICTSNFDMDERNHFNFLLKEYNIKYTKVKAESFYIVSVFSAFRLDLLNKGANRFYIEQLKLIINNDFIIGLYEIFDGGIILPCLSMLKVREILKIYHLTGEKFIPMFSLNNGNYIVAIFFSDSYSMFEMTSDFLKIKNLKCNLEYFIVEIFKFSIERLIFNEDFIKLEDSKNMSYYYNFSVKINSDINFKDT